VISNNQTRRLSAMSSSSIVGGDIKAALNEINNLRDINSDLLETTEILLKWIIAEREATYDLSTNQEGEYSSDEDRQEVAEYDEFIMKVQAVIKKAKGE